ncbi:hypothetical protein F5Y05DRAFT_418417 [Hypoxylon sp. FL0543]|nr:hypothetical protein F5Y05DRAFT_418417 [Hypoxylon sp. FL0543]
MTEITTVTQGPDGKSTTNTYTLPAQTTPYMPLPSFGESRSDTTDMPESCSLSVFCRGVSGYAYSAATAAHDPHPLDGQRCYAVQRAKPRTGADIGFNEACWPVNYFALFDDEYGEIHGSARTRDEGPRSTAAFPGGNCLAGWTTACTTTIQGGGGTSYYPQAWCCPPGEWSCATATGDGDLAAPQRLCRSYLTGTTSTTVWMYWDPPYESTVPLDTTTYQIEAFTWTAVVPAETDTARAATVFHKVFPLVLSHGLEDGLPRATATAAGVEVEEEDGTASVADLQSRADSGPDLLGGGRGGPSSCLAAGLLGAALAIVTLLSLFGLAVVHRRGRRDRRCRELAGAAALVKGPFEVGKYEEGGSFR